MSFKSLCVVDSLRESVLDVGGDMVAKRSVSIADCKEMLPSVVIEVGIHNVVILVDFS